MCSDRCVYDQDFGSEIGRLGGPDLSRVPTLHTPIEKSVEKMVQSPFEIQADMKKCHDELQVILTRAKRVLRGKNHQKVLSSATTLLNNVYVRHFPESSITPQAQPQLKSDLEKIKLLKQRIIDYSHRAIFQVFD